MIKPKDEGFEVKEDSKVEEGYYNKFLPIMMSVEESEVEEIMSDMEENSKMEESKLQSDKKFFFYNKKIYGREIGSGEREGFTKFGIN